MIVKKFLAIVIVSVSLLACTHKEEKGKFTLDGTVKNVPEQKVYLEQLFFSQQEPQVLDTGDVKAGKFSLSSIATEDGLYRIRFEKLNNGFIFINDKSNIDFKADVNDMSLQGPSFSSPANIALKNFLLNIEGQRLNLVATSSRIDSLKKLAKTDSAVAAENIKLAEINNRFNKFIVTYIDTTSQPIIALFALGYSQSIDPAALKTVVPGLLKRFPTHQGIAGIVAQFNDMMAAATKKQNSPGPAAFGNTAPDFSMNDTEGKPFALSQLRGKYVLVDFWASWCGPCRGENPNVVAAYNQFKDKNFTVLGVSLDEDKDKWLEAIKKDNLTWKHVSDLKGWQNATVSVYGYDGIPYNVLVDPQGKILATSLRGSDLQAKLAEVLR